MMTFKEKSVLKSDYYSALADYGHSDASFREFIESEPCNEADLSGVYCDNSEIHGKGLFSSRYVKDGEIVTILFHNAPTKSMKYVNHSNNPNMIVLRMDGDLWTASKKDIHKGEELTIDYRNLFQEITGEIERKTDVVIFEGDRKSMAGTMADAYDLFLNNDHLSNMSLNERMIALEAKLLKYPQVEIPVTHEFIDGLYARSIKIPKGSIVTGRIHPVEHMDAMFSGEGVLATSDGYKILKAPMRITSKAGAKKAFMALSDVVWTSYHPTQCKTVEEVEKEIFTDDFLEIDVS